jgi:hypothetical protein
MIAGTRCVEKTENQRNGKTFQDAPGRESPQ